MNRTQDFRRAQRIRRRAAAERAMASLWGDTWRDMANDDREIQLQVHIDNRTVCSCSMCGNPRRHFGLRTRAEMIADLAMVDGIEASS